MGLINCLIDRLTRWISCIKSPYMWWYGGWMLFPMSSFQTFQFVSSGPNGTCSIFLFSFISSYLKKKGGGEFGLGWRITIKYVPYPRTRSSRVCSCGDHCQPPYCVQWFYQYSLTKSVSWKYKYLLYKSEDNGSNWVVNISPGVKIKDDRISSKHYFLTWI